MRTLSLITRLVLPAIAVASLYGGIKHGYGFSTGR
jgi:hypothetical protein